MKRYLALLLLLASPAHSQTIDALGSAGSLTGTENVPIFQTANPAVKTTTGAVGNAGALTGDITKSAGSGVTTLAAGSASNLNSGTLAAGRMPALTGDCVTSAGAVATTCGFKTAGAVANLWQVPQGGWGNFGTQSSTMLASTISCAFGAVPVRQTISNVGAAVATLAASGNFSIGIYSNTNARPGTLIGNSGSISTAAVGTITGALAANKQIGPGGTDGSSDVWWCTNVDASAGGTVKFVSLLNAAATIGPGMLIGSTTAANVLNRLSSSIVGVSCAGANCAGGSSTFGSWPATLAGSTWTDITTSNIAIPVYKPTSVP